MKRLFVTLSISFLLISLSSFARDGRVSARVEESFNASFKGATEVSWTVVKDYYKVSFNLNGQYVSAYYNEESSLVAVSRNITSLQLPVTLQSQIKSNYEKYWISDLFEVVNEQGTTYYITIENGESKIILKSVSNFEWDTFKVHTKF